MMRKILGNPVSLIAGIGLFTFGGWHFVKLAVLPRLPGGGPNSIA